MLVMKERQPAVRTIEGWATSVLLKADAIRECEEQGWMKDRADPHARERAIEIASERLLLGLSQGKAVAAVRDVLNSIGDACPDCSPDGALPSVTVRTRRRYHDSGDSALIGQSRSIGV
jgi:hypothetical protein